MSHTLPDFPNSSVLNEHIDVVHSIVADVEDGDAGDDEDTLEFAAPANLEEEETFKCLECPMTLAR